LVINFKVGAYIEPRKIETGKYSMCDIENLKEKKIIRRKRLSPQSNTTSQKV